MKLLETWVKAPFLEGASLLIAGECVKAIYPKIYEDFSKDRVTLTNCPEADGSAITGKLASIITSSKPKDITILTIEGSPHCFTLHAAVNEALFVTDSNIPYRHFVIVNGKAVEVGSESVRVGRYLHLTQKCIDRFPEILVELSDLSLEHSWNTSKDDRSR